MDSEVASWLISPILTGEEAAAQVSFKAAYKFSAANSPAL